MDIVSAIKSGRPFRRKGWPDWFTRFFDCADNHDDILADDWEVKPEEAWHCTHQHFLNGMFMGIEEKCSFPPHSEIKSRTCHVRGCTCQPPPPPRKAREFILNQNTRPAVVDGEIRVREVLSDEI